MFELLFVYLTRT